MNENSENKIIESNFSGIDMGIRGRLFSGFALLAVILMIAVIFILIKITMAENIANQVLENNLPTYEASLDLQGQIYQSQSALRGWILTHDEKFKTEFDLAWSNADRLINKITALISNSKDNELSNHWEESKSLFSQLKTAQLKAENTPISTSALPILVTEVNPIANKIFDIIDGPISTAGERSGGMFDIQYHKLQNGTQEITHNISMIRVIEYILLGLTIILSVIISVFTARKILNPLNRAIHIAKKIASGERNIDINITSKDETGELLTSLKTMQNEIKNNENKLKKSESDTRVLFDKIVQTAKAFSDHSSKVAAGDLRERLDIETEEVMTQLGDDLNTMTDSLASITKQITQACHNMVSTLEEVRHSVDIQSSGASEQASSINQITASLDEIEKSSTQTMEKAKSLGEAAIRTSERGQQGLEAIEQSINGMRTVRDKVQTIAQTILDLSNQTQQIGEITALVNTLAQQSKMLALNASIEAAKAGEAGKGFAVVAAEVKNLAEQSEQSTTQVQKILEDIRHATEKAVMATEEGTKGVDHGAGLVEKTGEIVRNLSDVIHETTLASQQIEAAVRQESVGIEQITSGMNEINQVTASFAESVNQTIEAINNLAEIAKSLKEYIDVYKL